ncbi:hypothetical protein D0T12_21805 [Actinomadura spongiicola]|uniref:Uncharacterized protein n=1 Tax=Actinomadura spongiicola TaxID=2303421 RepID=A0A372GFE0_9ACTN|nr:hypothetical protein D0T12_21805 [Actinomadura spongiicola]
MHPQSSPLRAGGVQTATEKWRFHCLRCLHVWEELYEARYCGDAVAWRLSGVAAQPPWVDRACRGCDGLWVKALPDGLVARRVTAK